MPASRWCEKNHILVVAATLCFQNPTAEICFRILDVAITTIQAGELTPNEAYFKADLRQNLQCHQQWRMLLRRRSCAIEAEARSDQLLLFYICNFFPDSTDD